MLEAVGDLWAFGPVTGVTTNGVVTKDGRLVMGAGVARQARDRYPGVDRLLGGHVHVNGNVPCYLAEFSLLTFPTKGDWREPSSLGLMTRSALLAAALVRQLGIPRVFLPRPGCGLGGLSWDDVRFSLSHHLDDRFTVVSPEK